MQAKTIIKQIVASQKGNGNRQAVKARVDYVPGMKTRAAYIAYLWLMKAATDSGGDVMSRVKLQPVQAGLRHGPNEYIKVTMTFVLYLLDNVAREEVHMSSRKLVYIHMGVLEWIRIVFGNYRFPPSPHPDGGMQSMAYYDGLMGAYNPA